MVTDKLRENWSQNSFKAKEKSGNFSLSQGKLTSLKETFVRNMSFPLLCTCKPVCELYCTLKKCKVVSVFTSGYVNTETILHFFYKITKERETKTVVTYAHVKWFYSQSERAYYLNYFIIPFLLVSLSSNIKFFGTFHRHESCRTDRL